MNVTNAVIKHTFIGFEDNVLGVYLGVFVGENQLIRVVNIQEDEGQTSTLVSNVIRNLLEKVGVGSWEQLPEKACRIKIEDGQVIGLGNLLTDNWMNFAELKVKNQAEFEEVDETATIENENNS